MSLKHYVFTLLALLLLLFAGVQLILFGVVEERVADEITAKSEAISDVALQVFSSNQVVTDNKTPGVEIRIIDTPNRVIDLGDGMSFTTGDETFSMEVTTLPQEKKQDTNGLAFTTVGSGYQFFTTDHESGAISQHVVQFEQDTSALREYFQALWVITATLLLVGIAFAYWLARHISKPLNDLSTGFTSLEKGELGSQIPVSGVSEVQSTLAKFNQTSRKLEALQTMQQQMREHQQMAELGEVARGLAHSLRNPLNTIGLAVEQLCQSNIDADAQRILSESIRNKIQQMDVSIQSLLQLSTGDIERSDKILIKPLVDDIRLELAASKDVQINVDVDQALSLNGAETEIRTMLHVLLSNAVEASQNGQCVSVIADRQANQVVIRVIDQGCGVPEALLTTLFQPHVTGKPEGAGMGLFIVKRLCELYYNGSISLVNNAHSGATATLILQDAVAERHPHD